MNLLKINISRHTSAIHLPHPPSPSPGGEGVKESINQALSPSPLGEGLG